MVEEWIEDILSINRIAEKDKKTTSRIIERYWTWLTKQISFINNLRQTKI